MTWWDWSIRRGSRERHCSRSCSGDVTEVHEEIFAEVTYHAAYEPQRAVRTSEVQVHAPLRRTASREGAGQPGRQPDQGRPVGGGVGRRGPAVGGALRLVARSLGGEQPHRRPDPGRGRSRTSGERLHDWMVRTGDPLLDGPVPPAEGTVVNTVDQVSASDPTTPPSTRSLTHSRRARNVAESLD